MKDGGHVAGFGGGTRTFILSFILMCRLVALLYF